MTHPSPTEPAPGSDVADLDTPQLLVDLDVVDGNVRRMFAAARGRGVRVRVHFKSLKCTGLARHVAAAGPDGFAAAKLNEAEALADAGVTDILLANQVVGLHKLRRAARLARRADLIVCVDDADNARALSAAAVAEGTQIRALVEVDIGMARCGVPPGAAAVELAQTVAALPGLRFYGLQGYDGHLQMLPDYESRQAQSLAGAEALADTRRQVERAGLPVALVTGGGTGTWEFAAAVPGVTEVQPGSFVIMDAAYHKVRPEFGCALSVRAAVVSRRPGQYVLDAGSKAISRDFGTPEIKGRPGDRVLRLNEEHTIVAADGAVPAVGEAAEVLPAHCCATMNLHRACAAVRGGRVEAVWPIECSGRYD
ncbi:D-threonine aldolase [Gemmata obscuriglobus]|uniref:Alanine racemase n=1 Tax=Gemmata obscuriglobus TaxID=114 RepID=A0A2Z3GUM3_9BACT|nr:DSD1 family PLP-dependent enzyme [Gemmata obscuriglobus]AWM35752.1 alanine racemase [Gemmata obscuriglobus]QEG31711.1 D-threonine aldolase [Gemmata obscuriglobus]VTS11057.1 Alanine racemase domain protein OS=Pedosphaera parvula (strain Ellin514) GN=Cflav_PD4201 PE=4 SV=1: Ala_racemase_N: D-ser_dehydrat [Gemmata obscuriglobus UQM 2246]